MIHKNWQELIKPNSLEITPGSLRLRKKLLKESDRKRESRQAS